MRKSILLCASLCLFSAPALAQAPVGGVDGTLGNGNVESQAPGVPNAQPRAMRSNPAATGGVDGTFGNGNVESQAPGVQSAQPRSARTNPAATGGVDGTFGNGDVESQAINNRPQSTGSTRMPTR